MTNLHRKLLAALSVVVLLAMTVTGAQAAERANVEAFLKTTGFDVAIDSITLAAENAPAMLGLEDGAFGAEWSLVARRVFDSDFMQNRAIGILEATLQDDVLAHAAGFYASDLGARLVEAENFSHFEDDTLKYETGQEIVAGLVAEDSPRLELLKRMNHAIDPNEVGADAVQEIQIRFLLAAAYAGVIELRVDEQGLRAALKEGEADLRREMEASALANAAYTYRDFTDEEVLQYAEALEEPDMQTVYELMNAVHFEVMMNRFEALAAELGQVQPSQEL
ncbi:DUF2059 domain-containing protein [uncultured Shimia sp.]|uniref:DUF2059 domain-containing protein n=1 Tax=uncultured Shimia sp. TaxID=573152 RepID=UPI00260262FA|nr:DUF2059 domain-containing protein [uncultured Shimia sp.]